jgi:hypothetical protein
MPMTQIYSLDSPPPGKGTMVTQLRCWEIVSCDRPVCPQGLKFPVAGQTILVWSVLCPIGLHSLCPALFPQQQPKGNSPLAKYTCSFSFLVYTNYTKGIHCEMFIHTNNTPWSHYPLCYSFLFPLSLSLSLFLFTTLRGFIVLFSYVHIKYFPSFNLSQIAHLGGGRA